MVGWELGEVALSFWLFFVVVKPWGNVFAVFTSLAGNGEA
jgi:hypothetical protein